jgi:signal transduction histidine kinase
MQNCYRLQRLINNLLDITHIDVGHYTLNRTVCNIVQVIETLTLSVKEFIEKKGIMVFFRSDVPQKMVNCDISAVERIILNLLSNAIKVTLDGGTIEVNIQELDGAVHISVKNDGPCIREDNLSAIFEKFKQTDHLFTRNYEGAGIGLWLVKSLVEMHDGHVFVKTSEKKGTEFIVELPDDLQLHQKKTEDCLEYNMEPEILKKVQVELSDICL